MNRSIRLTIRIKICNKMLSQPRTTPLASRCRRRSSNSSRCRREALASDTWWSSTTKWTRSTIWGIWAMALVLSCESTIREIWSWSTVSSFLLATRTWSCSFLRTSTSKRIKSCRRSRSSSSTGLKLTNHSHSTRMTRLSRSEECPNAK